MGWYIAVSIQKFGLPFHECITNLPGIKPLKRRLLKIISASLQRDKQNLVFVMNSLASAI
jgi:hypothetical protein